MKLTSIEEKNLENMKNFMKGGTVYSAIETPEHCPLNNSIDFRSKNIEREDHRYFISVDIFDDYNIPKPAKYSEFYGDKPALFIGSTIIEDKNTFVLEDSKHNLLLSTEDDKVVNDFIAENDDEYIFINETNCSVFDNREDPAIIHNDKTFDSISHYVFLSSYLISYLSNLEYKKSYDPNVINSLSDYNFVTSFYRSIDSFGERGLYNELIPIKFGYRYDDHEKLRAYVRIPAPIEIPSVVRSKRKGFEQIEYNFVYGDSVNDAMHTAARIIIDDYNMDGSLKKDNGERQG